ncbi:hypothetical protein P5673_009592, partial [Acropora cervicornis]
SNAFDDIAEVVDTLGDKYQSGLTWSNELQRKLKLVKRVSVKSHMKTFLNSGNIKAAKQVKKAFEYDGGLHGVHVTICYLDRPQQSPKWKWEGVISINNVKHRDHGMRAWRAYGIGKEKFVSRSDFENLENFSLPHLTVVKDALHPKQ